MARKKNYEEMSAQELYELARQREKAEQDEQREAVRAQLEALKERRREVLAQHRKELTAIDREIRALGGRTRARAGGGGGGGEGRISDQVLAIIGQAGEVSTKDLKAELDSKGVETRNLNQLLAYLKRNGRVVSAGRGMYSLP